MSLSFIDKVQIKNHSPSLINSDFFINTCVYLCDNIYLEIDLKKIINNFELKYKQLLLFFI